ncbi:hypothetical protein NL676_011891 [Syzygium grande]|nr:hypothetical protein NL676_011891 [Syzygium grande]
MTGKGTCGGYGDAPEIVARKVAAAAVSRVALSFAGNSGDDRGWNTPDKKSSGLGVAGVFGICLLDAEDCWGCSCAGRRGVRLCSSSRKRHRDGDYCELVREDRPRCVKSEVVLKRDEPR